MIHHSDQGMQYVSIRHIKRLAETSIQLSVVSVTDPYDNALAEPINRFARPSRFIEIVEWATLA